MPKVSRNQTKGHVRPKPQKRSIKKQIAEGEYILHYVFRPVAQTLETDAAENQTLGVIWNFTEALRGLEEDADGAEEYQILKTKHYIDMSSDGIFCARFWLIETEPGATLIEGDGLDQDEESLIEGCEGIEQYEAIPISPLKMGRWDGDGNYRIRWSFNPLKYYIPWKKRALKIDTNESQSDINLIVLVKMDQNQTVNAHSYIDTIYKKYKGANRLGLKHPPTKG